MAKEKTSAEPKITRWAIALDWFHENNRSISAIIKDYLCPRCAKQLSAEGKEASTESLMSAIQGCCSQSPGFINDRLPILEGVFRFFLRNGNSPLAVDELGEQLAQLRGGDAYRNSPDTLLRLLKSDRYYGLQEIQD